MSLLFRVAEILRERKFELMAWLVFEVGKNWAEADADIAETIDFCEFYAREAHALRSAKAPVQLPGEHDQFCLHSAGSRRGDSAVEFSLRDHGGHDAGLDRLRQHRDPEAVQRLADHCGEIFRSCSKRPGCRKAW